MIYFWFSLFIIILHNFCVPYASERSKCRLNIQLAAGPLVHAQVLIVRLKLLRYRYRAETKAGECGSCNLSGVINDR